MAKRPTTLAPSPDDVQLAIPLPTGTDPGSEKWWGEEIEEAQKRRKKEIPIWQANLDRYRGEKPKLIGLAARDILSVNVDFEKVEAKKSQLFFQQPDIMLEPRDGQNKEIAALFRDVVNYYLGTDEANVLSMVDEVMLDVLCPAGVGPTKIGFEEVKLPVDVPMLDQTTGQPVLDPTTGQPQSQTVNKRVYARYFWERISPARFLVPKGFKSTNWDRAPWLGFEYDLSESEKKHANSAGPGPAGEDQSLSPPNDKDRGSDAPDKGIEIWYQTSKYDSAVSDPRRYRRLVMTMQGKRNSRIIIHEDSPYQTLTPNGAFESGMLGNPIHPLNLRPMTDSAYVPSDSTVSRNQVDELSTGRSQMILQRKRNLPMRGVDRNKVDKKVLDALERGEIQSVVGTDGDPDQVIKVVASANLPQEDFTFNQHRLAGHRSLVGARPECVRHARRAARHRDRERERAARHRQPARQRAQPHDDVVRERRREILRAAATVWRRHDGRADHGRRRRRRVSTVGPDEDSRTVHVPHRPDSSVRVDAAEDLDRVLRAYNLLARDPHINRVELLSQIVVKFGMDPQKVVVAQLPPPPPEPPKPSISIKAEDLSNPIVMQLLGQFGIKLQPPAPVALGAPPAIPGATAATPPSTGVAPSPPHPGGAERVQPVDQHEADRSGRRSGPGPVRAH